MKYFSYLKIPAWKLCSSFDTRNDRWLQNTDQCILSFFSNLSTMAQTRSAAVSFVCKFTSFVVEMRGQRVSQTCSNKLSPLVLISLCVYVCLCKSVFTLFTSKNVTWFALFHLSSACVYSVFCFGCFLTLSLWVRKRALCSIPACKLRLVHSFANLFPLWRCSDKTEQRTVTCRARRTAEFLFLWPLHFFFSTNSNKGDFSTL